MAKEKAVRMTTPKGIASYPHLNKPDTRFNPDGEFKVTLVLGEEAANKMAEKMQAVADKAYDDAVEAAKGSNKKKITKADVLKPQEDADGNETGQYVFTAKMKAHVKPKKGDAFDQAPVVFDAHGKQIKGELPKIGGGSTLKLNCELIPYYVASTKEAGCSLRLKAVQIIDLVEWGANAESYGFGDEDGYTADDDDDSGFGDETDGEEEEGVDSGEEDGDPDF